MPANAAEFGHGFVYRRVGDAARRRTIVALHGSGADEETMLPLAEAINGQAQVLALRGRVDQNGERRWFRKHSPTSFDQDNIREEASAFAAFLDGMQADGVLDLSNTLVVGYSNGGNLVHSTMLLQPGRIRRAVLLRCMPVLARPPMTNLAGCGALVISGKQDATYGPYADRLTAMLRRRHARVAARMIETGHMFGAEDAEIVQAWLRQGGP